MDALAGITVSSGSMSTLRLTLHSRSRYSHHDNDLCSIAQSPNKCQTVIYSCALLLHWLTTPIKLEYDSQSTREEFPGLTVQTSRLTPLPKIAFSVQTGMLTSLCAITAITCVSHHLLTRTMFSDPERYRSSPHQTPSYMDLSISCWVDVRANTSYGDEPVLILVQCIATHCWRRSTFVTQFARGRITALAYLCVNSAGRIYRTRLTAR